MPSAYAVLRTALPGWLLLQCAGANAVEACVGSSSDLNTVLVVAGAATGQATVIKLQQGTYHLGGSVLVDVENHFNTMQLLGGYNADCTERTLDPANTVLDADDNGEISVNPAGDLLVEGITWQSSLPFFFDMDTLAQHINVRLSNNAFIQCAVGFDTELNFAGSVTGDTLRITNNLFSGVPDKFGNGAINLLGGFGAVLTGNTIAGNGNRGFFTNLDGSITLADNIFWNNGGNDLELRNRHGDAISATFHDNTYATLSGSEDASSFGTLHTDPLFVDAASGNYRLQNASPAVNSGTATSDTPGVDLDGNARVTGSTVDRGAYESGVDDTLSQVLTVTSANDSGAGTLRDAIGKANALSDFNYIEFNIPGTCPVIISTTSTDLPTLTSGAKIDGFSQPGSAPNTAVTGDSATRCIILNGGGTRTNGIGFSGGSTTHLWVQGIAFEGFTGAGLSLGGGNGDIVVGNQFGGKVGGTTLASNTTNIKLVQAARNALVGIDAPAFRNVIAGASNYGISIGAVGSAFTGHIISGNLFGTYGNEAIAAGNVFGSINITTGGNTISDNVIVYGGAAMDLSTTNAQGNSIVNNRVGRADQFCLIINHVQNCLPDAAPNSGGVGLGLGAHDNVIQGNTIWNNTEYGVGIVDASQGNLVSANSIFNNGCCVDGVQAGGIDLVDTIEGDYDGASGASSLPNRGQNAPVGISAYGGSQHGWLQASLASSNGGYAIEAFASVARSGIGYGEGSTYVGAGSATIAHAPVGANGHANFGVVLSSAGSPLTTGLKITATATDSLNNTSQFSTPVDYLCDVIFANDFDDAQTNACAAP